MTETHFLFDKVSDLLRSGKSRQAVELLVSKGWDKLLAEQQVFRHASFQPLPRFWRRIEPHPHLFAAQPAGSRADGPADRHHRLGLPGGVSQRRIQRAPAERQDAQVLVQRSQQVAPVPVTRLDSDIRPAFHKMSLIEKRAHGNQTCASPLRMLKSLASPEINGGSKHR